MIRPERAWNNFDFVIVVACLLPEDALALNVAFLRLLRLMRLLKLVRKVLISLPTLPCLPTLRVILM